MIGLELIMWPQSQWEASKRTAPNGTATHPDRRIFRLYDWIGPVGPIQWKWFSTQYLEGNKCTDIPELKQKKSNSFFGDWGPPLPDLQKVVIFMGGGGGANTYLICDLFQS